MSQTNHEAETANQPVQAAHSAETETHEEIAHHHTLFAEPVGQFLGVPITNSLLNSWIVVVIVVILAVFVKRSVKLVPRGIQNLFESVIESFLNIFDSVTGERKKSLKYAPLVLSFFFFILINNWLGILPGIGSIGQVVMDHGEKVFVPYFRGGTADLNTTLALAIIGVVASHVFGVMAVGAWQHLNKFINIKAFLEIPKKIAKDPTIILVNPIKAFVGIVEIVGELAKIASLSFRLFGNIFAGEVLLASVAALIAFAVPIPFMFLEVVVGLIQAFIFAMLILTYVIIHTEAEEH